MTQTKRSNDEIVRRGEEIYIRDLKALLEPLRNGVFLVLDVDSGDYEVDPDEMEAIDRAMARNPSGARYIKRIGFAAAHRLGGGMRLQQ